MRVHLHRVIRFIVGVAGLSLFMVAFALPAYAADIDIEIESGLREGDPGTLLTLAAEDVGAELQGRQCDVTSIAVNQESVHPNSDLFVQSGGTEVALRDVESAPDVTVRAEGTLTLGEEIVVMLRFGEDGMFSGGMTVSVDCPETSRVVVIKEVTEGSSTTQEFEFSASYAPDGFSLAAGEQHDSGPLEPGPYSLSEIVPDGWELVSAECDDSNSSPPELNLLAGETVTCVFTNDGPDGEVEAAIVVNVEGACEVVGGEPVGQISVSIAVDGGAEIVIRSSDGEVVETFTEDGTISVPEGRYTWEATPAPGFVFPEGFEDSGSLNIVCDEVMASILVTVSGRCDVVGDRGVGRIAVTISVAGGADVVVRDSAGEAVGSLSADGTLDVSEGATYTWEASPNEGFEFPPGAQGSGTVTIETCSPTEVLPFTGLEADQVMAVGAMLLLVGGLALVSTRRLDQGS